MQLIIEIVLTVAVILVLLVVCGVSFYEIQLLMLWALTVLAAAMTLFFLVSIAFLFLGKRCEAHFLRIDRAGRMGGHAVYQVEDAERMNWYPAEDCFRSLIYRERPSKAILWQKGKCSLLFDWYSILIAAIGFPLCTVCTVRLLVFLL